MCWVCSGASSLTCETENAVAATVRPRQNPSFCALQQQDPTLAAWAALVVKTKLQVSSGTDRVRAEKLDLGSSPSLRQRGRRVIEDTRDAQCPRHGRPACYMEVAARMRQPLPAPRTRPRTTAVTNLYLDRRMSSLRLLHSTRNEVFRLPYGHVRKLHGSMLIIAP